MPDAELGTGWIAAGISSVIAALSGAVATLFKINESKSAKAIAKLEERLDESDKKHEECLEDRIELSKQIAKLEGQLAQLIETR